MSKDKRVLTFFVCTILIIYGYGFLHDYIYQHLLASSHGVELSYDQFRNVKNQDETIQNRMLLVGEDRDRAYRGTVSFDALKTDDLRRTGSNRYLMIEKPDVQYLKVFLNGQELGDVGDELGRSNLWNGTYFFKFNESVLEDMNTFEFQSFSYYTAGIGGRILVVPQEQYKHLNRWVNISTYLVRSASIVAFFSVFIFSLMIIAWRGELYNISAYCYFLLALFLIGIATFDYQPLTFIGIPYLLYSKVIAISLHGGIAFLLLAVASLLNARIRVNFGMVNLLLIVYFALTRQDMISFSESYKVLNFFMIGAVAQLVALLIVYRKRGKTNVNIMILGFSLCGFSVVKLVFISSRLMGGTTLIDIPILMATLICIILLLFYFEMVHMIRGHEVAAITDDDDVGLTSYMQGSFTIDKTLMVVGAYSNACDHIFGQLIVGKDIESLFGVTTLAKEVDHIEVFKMIFDTSVDFKDGYIAFLPERLKLEEREYRVHYQVEELTEILLRITLSDITKNVALEEKLNKQRSDYELILNTLKSKHEVGAFIERTNRFIPMLRQDGFTSEHMSELHLLKGSLGQLGFSEFERAVHEVEDGILEGKDQEALIIILEDALAYSLEWLDEHIGVTYLSEGCEELTLTRPQIEALEKEYIALKGLEGEMDSFLRQLKELRLISIKEMLLRYNDYIQRLAGTLEKSVYPLEIFGDNIMVDPKLTEEYVRSLVGLFRNSLIHGIEIPEERMVRNKNSTGKISCHLLQTEDIMRLTISDDGRGIEIDNQSIEWIFDQGMTTVSDANLIAGRGLGLSAVRDIVASYKGRVEVKSDLGVMTKFIMEIPLEMLRG